MNILSRLFPCRHKETTLVYSFNYPNEITWIETKMYSAFLQEQFKRTAKGPNFLVIYKCNKCGQLIVGLESNLGTVPIQMQYLDCLFKETTCKNINEIIKELN